MPFVSGFLHVRGGGHPDNSLPGAEGPVDPGYGVDVGGRPDQGLPPFPSHGLPTPPPGVWPPPTISHPIVPIHPDNSLPVQPGTIWPSPGGPNRPNQGLPGYGHPDQGLPGSQPHPDQGLPGDQPGIDNSLPGSGARPDNSLPSGTFWVVAGIPGLGWRYIAVDPSLSVGGGPVMPTPSPK
jgi:hypothetical protein